MLDNTAIESAALGLLNRSLPKVQWTHEAHFAAVLWLLRHRPESSEPAALRAIIRAYNEATGTANTDSSGYHHTITLASLRAAKAWLDDRQLADVLAEIMASSLGRSDWLLMHWSRGRLFSPLARRDWVAPNLVDLPF
ncbi:hypothetical protein [Novosphingobium sp. 9]|uniref:hypothetical protein n=1 Tax=Novosphingobium sp. 9 TaxID=2025349 RepID=UPI0021B60E69|nr:hypothetical protein [Novosphingobium sp. 9]